MPSKTKYIDGLRKKESFKFGTIKRIVLGGAGLVLVCVSVIFFYKDGFNVKSATFGWLQTDWSGGASTTAVASHSTDQTGWNKFYSKDANVDVTSVPGEIRITETASTSVTTSDSDFTAFTLENSYVSGGAVYAKKPNGGSCSASSQCINGWCYSNVCTNPWLTGSCAGIEVYYTDSGPGFWQTSTAACSSPQCSSAILSPDNTIDFSSYPARNTCKALGGRLPSRAELACIYTNRAEYDDFDAFATNIYWTNNEYASSNVWVVSFSSGSGDGSYPKSGQTYFRCIK